MAEGLTQALEDSGAILATERADRAARQQTHSLRQEQDDAYLASLAADREKVRRKLARRLFFRFGAGFFPFFSPSPAYQASPSSVTTSNTYIYCTDRRRSDAASLKRRSGWRGRKQKNRRQRRSMPSDAKRCWRRNAQTSPRSRRATWKDMSRLLCKCQTAASRGALTPATLSSLSTTLSTCKKRWGAVWERALLPIHLSTHDFFCFFLFFS